MNGPKCSDCKMPKPLQGTSEWSERDGKSQDYQAATTQGPLWTRAFGMSARRSVQPVFHPKLRPGPRVASAALVELRYQGDHLEGVARVRMPPEHTLDSRIAGTRPHDPPFSGQGHGFKRTRPTGAEMVARSRVWWDLSSHCLWSGEKTKPTITTAQSLPFLHSSEDWTLPSPPTHGLLFPLSKELACQSLVQAGGHT